MKKKLCPNWVNVIANQENQFWFKSSNSLKKVLRKRFRPLLSELKITTSLYIIKYNSEIQWWIFYLNNCSPASSNSSQVVAHESNVDILTIRSHAGPVALFFRIVPNRPFGTLFISCSSILITLNGTYYILFGINGYGNYPGLKWSFLYIPQIHLHPFWLATSVCGLCAIVICPPDGLYLHEWIFEVGPDEGKVRPGGPDTKFDLQYFHFLGGDLGFDHQKQHLKSP